MRSYVRETVIPQLQVCSKQFSKAEVNYSVSKYPTTSCGVCDHYVDGGRCLLVRGPIRTSWWCGLFTPELNLDC